ncbi:hypothetical protein [Fluviicola chungangensis]|uniref:DUF3575 domain-containing protein n=1 Tax=Fluviicola chungangensis TaxID=2597671 RepID=A0A556MQ29_9FLAO|nr:hypothetical protein [Fluviicola chungangensis]TSJ41975.1 hypothetical protein FO442_12860 [Fluviicola chungangensis]
MKKLLGIILLSAVSLGAHSQETMEDSGEKRFVLKFCPTQLFAGEFNFSYEQRVARILSLELEVGPTISQFGVNFGNQRLWQGNDGLGVWQFQSIGEDAEAAIGFHVSLAPKFYPTSEDNQLKGLYLSPVFKYRKYNYINEDINGILDDAKSHLDQMIFRFNMGFQFWPGDGNFSIDMYFGVGLSTFHIQGQSLDSYVDDQGYTQTRWSSFSDTGIRFNAATGLKFGFGM